MCTPSHPKPVEPRTRPEKQKSASREGVFKTPNPDTPHQRERGGARWCATTPANGRLSPGLHESRTQFSKGEQEERVGVFDLAMCRTHTHAGEVSWPAAPVGDPGGSHANHVFES